MSEVIKTIRITDSLQVQGVFVSRAPSTKWLCCCFDVPQSGRRRGQDDPCIDCAGVTASLQGPNRITVRVGSETFTGEEITGDEPQS